MKRRTYSILIIITFILVQLGTIPIGLGLYFFNPNMSEENLTQILLMSTSIAFVIGTIVVIILGNMHKDKNRIERGKQADIPSTVAWIVGGLFFAYLAQTIAGMINVYALGNPMESENTQEIMQMIQQTPYMIIIVAVLGPIIEEFVFRRAIFGEIYELISNKVVSFIVAALISGLAFSLVHFDFTHILIYMAMSLVFSFLYVISGRILVPIFVHCLMNGIVVTIQIMFNEQIQNLNTNFIQNLTQVLPL